MELKFVLHLENIFSNEKVLSLNSHVNIFYYQYKSHVMEKPSKNIETAKQYCLEFDRKRYKSYIIITHDLYVYTHTYLILLQL